MKKSKFIFLLLICVSLLCYGYIACIPTLNNPPIASFYEKIDPEGSLTVYFYADPYGDPDGTIISYEWDFGDGTSGKDVNTFHTYNEFNTYSVVLTVTDDNGSTGELRKAVEVLPLNEFPQARLILNPTHGEVSVGNPVKIYFDGTNSYDPDGNIIWYIWDFDDGNEPEKNRNKTNSHWYYIEDLKGEKEKYFQPSLVVEDNRGDKSTPASRKLPIKAKQ